jgi:hypothetical protein
MAISRFQSSFKVRTDLMDNMTPNNVVQREVSTPAGEWKPASWLPVVWQNEKSKDYFTISSGKVVSFDASGRIVPSGLLRKGLDIIADVALDDTATLFSYDSNDVAARVIDIRTGKFVVEASTGPVSLQAFVNAVVESGWSFEAAVDPADLAADRQAAAKAILKSFISAPVGVAAYDVYVWAGDDPANLHYTNYQKQHLIQFFTDIQMRVPHVCEAAASVDVFAGTKISGADLGLMPRYAGLDMTNIMAYRAGEKIASHTSRSPVALAAGANAWNGRLRSEISLLARAGDYFVDGDAGTILFFEDGGNVVDPVDASGNTLTVLTASGYDSSSTKARMIHLVGDAKPGDIVTFDAESNFVAESVFVPTVAGANPTKAELVDAFEELHFEMSLAVGRVLELIKEPRGLLERVRTGFQGDEFEADAKMPGSATGGFSDLITLSEEVVADEIAVINIKVQ